MAGRRAMAGDEVLLTRLVKLSLRSSRPETVASCGVFILGKEFHQAARRQVGNKGLLAAEGLGGAIAAANGAFHGCRPSGGGPVTGEQDPGPGAAMRGPKGIASGS